MKQEKNQQKKFNWPQWVVMILYSLTGICCALIFIRKVTFQHTLSGFLLIYMEMLLLLVVVFFIHIIIHEAGHLVCGLLTGYRFCSFRIGGVMLAQTEGKLKLKRYALPGTGGQCLMAPPDFNDGKMPYVLYNLGGCLFNILFAFVALLLSLVMQSVPMAVVFLQYVALIGVIVALLNGIPMQLYMVNNDGYNALCLGRHPAELRAFWIQMKVMEQIAEGVRLKDMPDEWFTLPTEEEMQNSMCAAIAVFACNRLLDSLKIQEAGELIEKLLEIESGMVDLHRMMLQEDRLYCELVGKNDIIKVVQYWGNSQEAFEKQMKNHPSIIRTRYAFHLLYGLYEIKERGTPVYPEKDRTPDLLTVEKAEKLAEASKKRFEKCARTYPYPCEIESERELMEYARMQKEKK